MPLIAKLKAKINTHKSWVGVLFFFSVTDRKGKCWSRGGCEVLCLLRCKMWITAHGRDMLSSHTRFASFLFPPSDFVQN